MKKAIIALCALAATFSVSAQTLKEGTLSNVTQITSGAVRYDAPQFSPDGSMVAYTEIGLKGLYVMNADGTDKHQISEENGIGYNYEWSLDNSQILVRDTRWTKTERLHAIWAIDLNGKKVRMSEDAVDMRPASWRYSPKGDVSITSVDNTPVKVSMKRIALDRLKTLKPASGALNKSFALTGDEIYLIDEVGNQTLIVEGGMAFCPSFSPDGKKIAYVQHDKVYVMNADCSNRVCLGEGFYPTWVNNDQVVYSITTDNGHEYTTGNLFMSKINGSAKKQLTEFKDKIVMRPVASPDGSRIVFVNHTDGQIYSAELK